MQAFLRAHPWSILAAGAAIQILTGIPAAWGVFQQSVCVEYAFPQETGAMIFSCVICFFGIGCVIGGWLQDKKGPRVAGLCGTALLGTGFAAVGFLPPEAPWLFCAAFSAPVGLGCSFLYPAVMSCAQKWYTGRKGLATGIIGGAVGLSGAVLTVLGRFLIGAMGIRAAFWVLGAAMVTVCGAGCILLENPQEDAKGAALPPKNVNKRDKPPAPNYKVKQMMKTPQYYLLFAATGLATPAVLLFSPMIVEYAQARGLSEQAGLSCIVIGSLFSAAGRLFMPWVSDRIGRRSADLLLFAALALGSVGFWIAQGWWVILLYSVLTFCYSGEAAIIPSAVTDLFGQTQAGIHYGLVALGMSVGSIGFPLLARALSLEAARHMVAIGAALTGFVCLWFLKPTQGDRL